MKTIKINNEEYVRKSDIPKGKSKPTKLQIVVLQRGWVVIGRYREEKDEFICEDSYVIRKWGTSAGLGELAAGGPHSDTVLDKIGTVRSLKVTVVFRVDVDEEQWTDKF